LLHDNNECTSQIKKVEQRIVRKFKILRNMITNYTVTPRWCANM
jgi:hypothetical protein